MKKQIALFAIVTVALVGAPAVIRAEDATAPAAGAAAAPAKKHGQAAKGKISAVDATAMTLTVGEQTFTATADTKVSKSGKPATFADLAVGDSVSVSYKKGEADKLTATSITVGGKGKGKKKKSE
jgi:Domain of unknown function (DUF5666)